MKLRHCLFFQCPILHKTLITGGVRVVSGGVSMVSGMWNEEIFGHTNTKSIGKISISSDIALSPSTIYCIQISMSGGDWMVSESVWMMSRLCLRVSEDASIQNLLAEIYIRPWYSDIAFFFQCHVLYKNTYVWGLSGWCLTVSGSYVRVSGRCLGVYRYHINWKQFNKSCYIQLLFFLPVP